MLIAILSDTHDQLRNLRLAVDMANERGAMVMVHCGDLISPFMLKELARFNGVVHLVYGNNTGDVHLISGSCGTRFANITHHGNLGVIETDGFRIAFTHYPQMAKGLAATGNFEVVCCGHNHRYQVEKIDDTLLVNPGEMLGAEARPAFCLLDTAARMVERIEVAGMMFPEDEARLAEEKCDD